MRSLIDARTGNERAGFGRAGFYRPACLWAALAAALLNAAVAEARVNIVVVRNGNDTASQDFKLKFIPQPSSDDAASGAKVSIIDGARDRNGGRLEKLIDGRTPTQADQPAENFFFAAGTPGGRLLIDLGESHVVEQVNTYSWHPNTRGPQVYTLYAADGAGGRFQLAPQRGDDPERFGWRLVARVDTRPDDGEPGGQHGVSIFDSDGPLGRYRYLLFDIRPTEIGKPFDNTFYSEIDVVTGEAPSAHVTEFETDGGFRFSIDTSQSPELTEWAQTELAPVVREWYPKVVAMLPSDGYQAPRSFSIAFPAEMRGVAATSGTRIHCAPDWFRRNLYGEAKGAVVHELVHVVQQYGLARLNNPAANRPPGWLVEGIADYIRWFLYEPESGGAEITARNLQRARYDGSYRASANFLNWVTEQHDAQIVAKLNAALREGRYSDDLWVECTGQSVEELGEQWKLSLERALAGDVHERAASGQTGAPPSSVAPSNTLTDEEKSAGWQLLFNGRDFDGWHSFGSDGVRPGWQVVEGVLACADPTDAGDLCTDDEFEWFELRLEYKIAEGANSGIMYHVTDDGNWPWETGPELQLLDNARAADPTQSGWLYGLYQPPTDPETGKPLDATRPAGQWNEIRLLVSAEKCEHEINGVTYFEYVLGSDDFQQRVANSKFARMPNFAQARRGYIALQGDHGRVSFRNIKVRRLD